MKKMLVIVALVVAAGSVGHAENIKAEHDAIVRVQQEHVAAVKKSCDANAACAALLKSKKVIQAQIKLANAELELLNAQCAMNPTKQNEAYALKVSVDDVYVHGQSSVTPCSEIVPDFEQKTEGYKQNVQILQGIIENINFELRSIDPSLVGA